MWPRKIQAQVVIYRTFYVFAIDNINQGMNCPIFFGQPLCFSVHDEERGELF